MRCHRTRSQGILLLPLRRIQVPIVGGESAVSVQILDTLTLIDSSDEDAPFVVPARPSRRLVPESAEAIPQSIQDREVGTSFPLSTRGPDFCSGTAPTPVSLSNRFTVLDESAADVHVMTDGSAGSTERHNQSCKGTKDSASPFEFGVGQHAREPRSHAIQCFSRSATRVCSSGHVNSQLPMRPSP